MTELKSTINYEQFTSPWPKKGKCFAMQYHLLNISDVINGILLNVILRSSLSSLSEKISAKSVPEERL